MVELIFLSSFMLDVSILFCLIQKNSRKVLLVIYLSTFFCLSPFYLILHILGVCRLTYLLKVLN